MNNFIIIANPISGKGKAKSLAEQAHTALTESGKQGQLILTSAAGDAKRFAQEATANGTRFLIACGGDGTLHEVVNGIATVPNVTLGVLPCGRGNDFAAAIGVPLKPEAAIATLISGTPIHVDLGYCYSSDQPSVPASNHEGGIISPETSLTDHRQPTTDNYFITIATCGYDTEVSRRRLQRDTPIRWHCLLCLRSRRDTVLLRTPVCPS